MSAPAAAPAGSTAPDTVTFVTCNDLHLNSTNPVSRTDSYIDELFDLLGQLAQLAVAQRAAAILIAGDIFHHKAKISIPTLVRLVQWCRQLKTYGVDVLSIPGNHDLQNNRYQSLPTQPLGLLYALDAMVNVHEGARSYVNGASPLVYVGGVAFPHAFDLAHWRTLNTTLPTMDPARYRRVVLGHCFASPAGGDYFGEPVHAYSDLYEACPADVYVFGHDHSDGGIVKRDRGEPDNPAWFVNLGAISRGSLAHDDINRMVCCGLVRIAADRTSVLRVKLNAKPASEIFDLDLKAKRDAEQTQIDAFVERLSDTLAALGSTKTVEQHLDTLGLPQEVRQRMVRYITEVETPA